MKALQSTVQSNDSIDKQIYNTNNIPINQFTSEDKSSHTQILISENSDKIQNEIERKKVAPKKESLEMPEEFFPIWQDWIDYRKARKLKPYAAKYEQIS